tara:strand:- start:69 stop:182 length:114 start_codon:yes stop_codon:yes gene_type:complete
MAFGRVEPIMRIERVNGYAAGYCHNCNRSAAPVKNQW